MTLLKDIWRVGVLACGVESALGAGFASPPAVWLPNPGPLAYYADPFGLWREDRLFVFVERFDYFDRHGVIEVFTLDRALNILDRQTALAEPWHLSYPFVFEHQGETYLLPEAYQSGGLTLYRADRFPDRWTPAARIALDAAPIDATPLFHGGLWWLFYTPAEPEPHRTRALHLAFAESLQGPWRTHPDNPVRFHLGSARPGGAPFLRHGEPVLPVQDCTHGYGSGARLLSIHELTPDRFVAQAGPLLDTPAEWRPYSAMHTLSGVDSVTLVDAKRRLMNPATLRLDLQRKAQRLTAPREVVA